MMWGLLGTFFFISLVFFQNSSGLECHNCYGYSDDLDNCRPVTLNDLTIQLGQMVIPTRGAWFSRTPALTVSHRPDVCFKFTMETLELNGRRRYTVIRTQIVEQLSNLVSRDQLSETCELQTDIVRTERGLNTTSYCACTTDYCNGGSSLVEKGRRVLIFGLFGILTISLL